MAKETVSRLRRLTLGLALAGLGPACQVTPPPTGRFTDPADTSEADAAEASDAAEADAAEASDAAEADAAEASDAAEADAAEGSGAAADAAEASDATDTDTAPDCRPGCLNGGTCAEGGRCACPDGWGGPRCEVALPVFRRVEAGSFRMGSPEGEIGRTFESEWFSPEQQVWVTLSRPFELGLTELTQRDWEERSGGANPSCFRSATEGSSIPEPCALSGDNPLGPVETVSWWSAIAFANALSEAVGLPPCYTLPSDGCSGTWQGGNLDCGPGFPEVASGDPYACEGYRLPTEAEWEYAARAGTSTATYAGDLVNDRCVAQSGLSAIAWWCANTSGKRSRQVATRLANAWGFHDLLGNVAEWTWDAWAEPGGAGGLDPQRVASDTGERVIRGGDWAANASHVRAASRWERDTPGRRGFTTGFRLARTLPH